MAPLEMAIFISVVVVAVAAVVGIAWWVQWKKDPEGFKAKLKRDPTHKGGPFKR